MTHASLRHRQRKAVQAPKPRIIDPRERLGPLLEKQRELAKNKKFWEQRWSEIDHRHGQVPVENEERRARIASHRRTVGGHLRDLRDETERVREELSHVRSRIKEDKG